MRAQLAEKEFKLGELEGRVKDLFNEANELDEKLRIANRNARVLEEENSNFHLRIKAIERDEDVSQFLPREKEAMNLIKENEGLRASLASAEERVKASSGQSRESDHDADRQIRALNSDCERMRKERERESKELENTRFQCAELQKKLDDEQDTLKSARELWDQERERYHQRIEELLESNKNAVRSAAPRSPKPKGDAREEPLEQVFLKEDVAQLEKKLKEAQEKAWAKEKEWIRVENELRKRLQTAQGATSSEGRNDKALFQAMRDQVEALQEEIKALRREKLASRSAALEAAASRAAGGSSASASSAAEAPQSGSAANWATRYYAVCKEKDATRDQLDAAKTTIFELQNAADERAIVCKELEVQIAALQKRELNGGRSATSGRAASVRSVSDQSTTKNRDPAYSGAADNTRVISELRQRVRDLERDLSNVRNAQEQKETVSDVRTREYQKQVDELLRENASLRAENGSSYAFADAAPATDSMDGVTRLTKDKRESVEEVMRLLEFAWDSDEEAKRLLRRSKYQSASMAGQDAAKDDEIRRLQKLIDDLESQLRGMEKKASDVDDLRDAVDDLRKQIRSMQAENDKLRRKNGDLERSRDNAARDHGSKEKDASRRIEELQKEIDDLKRRLDDSRKPVSKPLSPAESPRTPRIAAPRRRTPEVSAMSQLSVRSTEEQRRSAVPEGAHLAFTVVELADVLRNGRPITEPGYVVIKLKSIKEKYKTSVKELSSVIRFDETFVFYLAQPDQDVITVHVFYTSKSGSREYHIGDACFSMATLYRGVPRQRIAPIVQNPGTKDARRAGQIEVNLQTDDFGKTMEPTEGEIEAEKARFNELVNRFEHSAPEKLHAADVYMASGQ